jgi:hypothetical protein
VTDISDRQALGPPLALLAVMFVSAALISSRTGVDGSLVFRPYIAAWAAVTFIFVLVWILVEVARLAPTRADNPLSLVLTKFRQRRPAILITPAMIFPTFLASYTWAKSSIPFAVGYAWERTWAEVDRLILGTDAWRIAHAIVPPAMAPGWSIFYAVVWGFALAITGPVVALVASRTFTVHFFTSLMLSWLVGGVVMAYGLSAAGPVFAHLTDPQLAASFNPLRSELERLLGHDDIVLTSQRYLATGMTVKLAMKGSGISAMPSMHIATATIFVLAARRTLWLVPTLLFWVMTFIGSIYLGYHYAVDAPAAALVAIVAWKVSSQYYRLSSHSRVTPAPHWETDALANPTLQRD